LRERDRVRGVFFDFEVEILWKCNFYPSPKQLKLLLTLPQGEGDKQESKKNSVL